MNAALRLKLWEGAATEGWAVQPKGKQGRKWSNWIYFGPSGARYNTKAEAEAAREFESGATAAADLAKLAVLQQEAQTPEELVGARVSVLWQEDGVPLSKKGPKDEDWCPHPHPHPHPSPNPQPKPSYEPSPSP